MSYAQIVGAILLYAGAVKALDMRLAERTLLLRVSFIPCHRVRLVLSALIGCQCALGSAIVFRATPAVTVPFAVAFFLAAAWVSVRSLLVGNTEDCGCYGGVRVPTSVSLGLNVLYLAALGFEDARTGWTSMARPGLLVVAVGIGVTAGVVAWRAYQKSTVDLSAIRVGRRWKRAWSGPFDLQRGEHIVVLMRSTCMHCEAWVPFLNIFDRANTGVSAVGIIPGDERHTAAFVASHDASFRVAAINAYIFEGIVFETPTAVRLREGRIAEIWIGHVAPPLVEQAQTYYRDLFEPAAQPVNAG